MINQDKKF